MMRPVLSRCLCAGVLGLAVMLAACGGDGMREVRVDDRMRMSVPEDLEHEPGNGDSGRLVNGELEVAYEFGGMLDDPALQGQQPYQVAFFTADERDATAEFFEVEGGTGRPYAVVMRIDDIGTGESLMVLVRAADEDGTDIALDIFRSIEFLEAVGDPPG